MSFSRASTLLVFFALALLAVATPNPQQVEVNKRWGSPHTTPTPTIPAVPTTLTVTTTTTAVQVCETNGGGKPPATTTTITVSAPAPTPTSQCNVGAVQCCDTVTTVRTSFSIFHLLNLIGYTIGSIYYWQCPLGPFGHRPLRHQRFARYQL